MANGGAGRTTLDHGRRIEEAVAKSFLEKWATVIYQVDIKAPPLLCSFCGKTEDEVGAVVGGASAMICDECIEVAKQESDRIKWSR